MRTRRRTVLALASAALASCELFYPPGDLPIEADGGPVADGAVDGGPVADGAVDGAPDADATPASRYRDAVLADAPIGYWRFEETSGDVAADESGHGNVATRGNLVTWGVPGALAGGGGRAIRLPGSVTLGDGGVSDGMKVTTGAFAFKGRSPFALEAWIRPTEEGSTFYHVFGTEFGSDTSRQEYGVWLNRLSSNVTLAFERIVLGAPINSTLAAPPLNAFAHVVAVYDGARVQVFLNGQAGDANSDVRSLAVGGQPAMIGARSPEQAVFAGDIDEAAIYDHALSSERIRAHYDVGRGL